MVCGTSYRPNNKQTKEHIHARLEDGFTEEDFYTVIDKKSKEWMGTKMEQYLRPQTLFNTKFESYLNQSNLERKKKGEECGMEKPEENEELIGDDWIDL